ncbi:glycosyltransferase involved in cell wall biosynthesis [Glaciihabitans tibetensis]|uniref:Glycosyltransferase involved in cell wall biosynthesis n=1 Tax=Glaciihabitans tibetensis TaxID=1266600 RepID=A0A2T0VF96_9MICO|nr:glycosyltransferase family 1 protein [Glaciihabitans tibetensis]PRY68880.1 glycosyltransferase involved in cell wall biosynthesis [Glaciihabitans tibetensis]
MTTTLRVIVDELLSSATNGVPQYTQHLTQALISTAPDNCEVSGVIASSSADEYQAVIDSLPGLASLATTALGRRELQAAWQLGLSKLSRGGMVHAPSLLAPLSRHDRVHHRGDQTVVTLHNTLALTHPESLSPREVAWQTAMLKRAHRFADAVVVPTHAVAAQLDERMKFSERIRVIGAAVSPTLLLPPDAAARTAALELPERYLLTVASGSDTAGLAHLIRALASEADAGLPLFIVGAASPAEDVEIARLTAEVGLPDGRVRSVGRLDEEDLAVILDRATVFVYPSLASGFGLPLLEAFFFGTPVVHSDDPALLEVSAGAGIAVSRGDGTGYPDRLAEAIAAVLGDPQLSQRLRYAGLDRSGAYTWRSAAQQVWQLHADL